MLYLLWYIYYIIYSIYYIWYILYNIIFFYYILLLLSLLLSLLLLLLLSLLLVLLLLSLLLLSLLLLSLLLLSLLLLSLLLLSLFYNFKNKIKGMLKFVKEIAPAKKKHAVSTTCLYPTKWLQRVLHSRIDNCTSLPGLVKSKLHTVRERCLFKGML